MHALHYQQIDVIEVQDKIKAGAPRACECRVGYSIGSLQKMDEAQIMREVENNAQGILERCALDRSGSMFKVPDINNVGRMEDRATCRIRNTSQLAAP